VELADREVAIAAAEAGAAVVRSRFGEPLARFEKSSGDFATAADIEAEKAILDILRERGPADRRWHHSGGVSRSIRRGAVLG
jgi:myo-inositol-1(or 4)-monophosphatase